LLATLASNNEGFKKLKELIKKVKELIKKVKIKHLAIHKIEKHTQLQYYK